MAHLGPDARSGDTVPSSSTYSAKRHDGNDLAVPATPPLAETFTGTPAATSFTEAGTGNEIGSQQSAMTASSLGTSTAASPTMQSLSQTTIPDSQASSSTGTANEYTAPREARMSTCSRTELATAADDDQRLSQSSAMGAANDRVSLDAAAALSRKRMSNGQVKLRSGSNSPIKGKGHARSASAISATSTGSHIGDVRGGSMPCIPPQEICTHMQAQISADLKTRLSYAMIKVNNGWQSHSLDQVETLASQAASPVSSNSTLHRRKSSSTSPKPVPTSSPQVHFAPNPVADSHGSRSPLVRSGKPCLAPPAPIQASMPKQCFNSRRNPSHQNPHPLLTHSHSAVPSVTFSPSQRIDAVAMSSSQPLRASESMLSPHQNTREQDAIKTLLFMSSPNNSANLRSTFPSSASPAPRQGPSDGGASRNVAAHGLRKGLPGQRPSAPQRRGGGGLDKSPAMGPPGSPMDLDSPQKASHQSPNSWNTKRRAHGASGHVRGALSLPSGLGLSNGRARQPLRDEDIERILDGAANDSSDDEEIQLPARATGVTRALGL